jgi:hypothetical protein
VASEETDTPGVDRRTLIKRSAALGGALVWTAPAVQSLGGVAWADTPGSPQNARCSIIIGSNDTDVAATGDCTVAFANDRECCGKLEAAKSLPRSTPGEKLARYFAILEVVVEECADAFAVQDSGCTPPTGP